ncbi:MAG: EF2563 family selenium-dependent molybdenum hydroxylase system protein [Synergistaceae bacterium]|nr:EF2563 family selenium-dependent molybdenum hydroxylase system protein [Synergistaceae bacterium]
MLACIRGAGDLASGIAVRLIRSNIKVIMLDIEKPTTVRRTVSFSEAVRLGKTFVEDIVAYRAENFSEALEIANKNSVAVLVDPDGSIIKNLAPDVLIDAIIAKKNLGTKINDAPIVIGVGPGFTVGTDCHAVIETKRGHTLGRAFYEKGSKAIKNTGIPGNIGGYSAERVLRAPCEGVINPVKKIGDLVKAGEVAATVDNTPLYCTIDGMLRGMLAPGVKVFEGMKSGDIDPRGKEADYLKVSDKALSIGGGVLEAILHFHHDNS